MQALLLGLATVATDTIAYTDSGNNGISGIIYRTSTHHRKKRIPLEDHIAKRRSSNLCLVRLVECRSMIQRAKKNWRRFKQSNPGHRYQDHYHHCQKGSRGRFLLRVILTV